MAGLWQNDPEQVVARLQLHKLEALVAATAVRLYLGGFGRVRAVRFCKLVMAAMLNLAGPERMVAVKLCKAW